MAQTVLSEHVNKKGAIELCPNCLKPLTPYWHAVLIEPYEDSDMAVITQERKCRNCNYTERQEVEQFKSIICDSSKDNSCELCISKCSGGCK